MSSMETKRAFRKALQQDKLDGPINHYIKHVNKKRTPYPCFVCTFELIMYYLSDCTAWTRFYPDRVIVVGVDEVYL